MQLTHELFSYTKSCKKFSYNYHNFDEDLGSVAPIFGDCKNAKKLSFRPQVNGRSFKGLFHEEVVRILREVSDDVCIVCARKSNGPSPLRGTIVDNVDTGRSRQAFASRVSLPNCFLNVETPASFSFLFGLFKQTIQFLQQINVKKCPSRILCEDLNP